MDAARADARLEKTRASRTRNGNVRYLLTTLCRDGTTHVIFEPLGFIARLAALVPTLRVNRAASTVCLRPTAPAARG